MRYSGGTPKLRLGETKRNKTITKKSKTVKASPASNN